MGERSTVCPECEFWYPTNHPTLCRDCYTKSLTAEVEKLREILKKYQFRIMPPNKLIEHCIACGVTMHNNVGSSSNHNPGCDIAAILKPAEVKG